MTMLGFSDLSALLSAGDDRTRAMLDLRAIYAGTRYETVTVRGEEVDALPWDVDTGINGKRIPASHRKPMVQIGVPDDVVDRIVDLAIGEGRFPAVELEGDAQGRLLEVMLGDDDLELAFHAPDQLVDLCVVGSMLLGFSHPVDPDGFSRWESVLIETEWAERVTAGGRELERSRELAAELAEVEGSGVEDAEGGPLFAMPRGIRSDDLVFLRYQWPVAEERAATVAGLAKRDIVVWRRRDYTSTAIIEYEPVEAQAGMALLPKFIAKPVEPHNWGIVPLVWEKSRGGRKGDTEGPSVLSPALQSLTAAADRSASFWTQASQVSGSPTLLELDVVDDLRDALVAADDPNIAAEVIGVGPKSVLQYRSEGQAPDVRFLEIDGAGPEALKTNTDSLIKLSYETARVTRHDPETVKGVVSGTALERLNEPSVAQASTYRAILGRAWRLLSNKLAVAMQAENEPGVSAEAFSISLRFPRIFRLTAVDVQAWTQALSFAVQGGVMSRQTAIGMLASVLEVEDADEEAARILEERGELFSEPAPATAPPAEDEGEEDEEGAEE